MIDIAFVRAVLLADGWHKVMRDPKDSDCSTFMIGEYGYFDIPPGDGDVEEVTVLAPGSEFGLSTKLACWRERDEETGAIVEMSCPVSSILGLKHGEFGPRGKLAEDRQRLLARLDKKTK